MKFSLILATIHRVDELDQFLKSLQNQNYTDFEVIIIDQNNDDRIKPIISQYYNIFSIQHLKARTGLSHARNIGLAKITGDVISFPDDDCWYTPDLLKDVNELLQKNSKWDGITGRILDAEGIPVLNRWASYSGYIPLYEPWNRVASPSIFLRTMVIKKVGYFDETLGVGSGTPWGSGEESDYIIRAIKLHCNIWYDANLTVGHPNPVATYDEKTITRGYTYALGFGRVQRIHNFPLKQVFYYWIRAFLAILACLIMFKFMKASFYWAVLKGRVKGWLLP